MTRKIYLLLLLFLSFFIFSFQDSVFSNFDYTDYYEEDDNDQNDILHFSPDLLFFENASLCIPKLGEFEIRNPGSHSVNILNIDSMDRQFFPLFSQAQQIQPNSSLKIQALFLPNNQNSVTPISSIFHINTSIGDHIYQVKGFGIPNQYKVRAFMGNKNYVGMASPDISIKVYNPFPEPLQILEIFTTENFIALHSQSINSTVVKPYALTEVISFSLITRIPAGYYHGFIHLHTNKDKMIIPVEMELKNGGLFPSFRELPFGLFTKKGEKKLIELTFWNFGSVPIQVTSITPINPEPRLTIEMDKPTLIPPSLDNPSKVAIFMLTTKTMDRIGGRILITTNETNSAYSAFEITYSGTVLHGKIAAGVTNTAFYISPAQLATQEKTNLTVSRMVTLTNRFNLPIQIEGVHVTTCSNFLSMNMMEIAGATADSFKNYPPILLELDILAFRLARYESLPKTCWLEIDSNATLQRIPIHLIAGKLELEAFEAVSNKNFFHISFNHHN
jgi:hypothetical protein